MREAIGPNPCADVEWLLDMFAILTVFTTLVKDCMFRCFPRNGCFVAVFLFEEFEVTGFWAEGRT